jgi:hypothetical protein
MTVKVVLLTVAIALSVSISRACQVDSVGGKTSLSSPGTGGKPQTIDSLHKAMKEFRAQQGKKIMELRNKIDAELLKPNPDRKLLASCIAQQSELRSKIADKWLESMLTIKSLTKGETFPQYVKGNWGCRCGDSDFGCVPKKEAEGDLKE